jgi:uncharacterized protein YbjT (DUF2867 family)
MRLAVAGGTGLLGRHVVRAAEERGHEVVVLSRARGVDVRTGQGLAQALAGIDVVIDVTNAGAVDEAAATAFFSEVAGKLHETGERAGVRHIVTVSIVGIDRVPFGYYAAKLRQEAVTLAGPVPATVLRATQFHEFAGQVLGWNRVDDVAKVPNLRVQTVAARTVGRALVDVAEGQPLGLAGDLAGPEPANLVDLSRALVARRGAAITVEADPAQVPDGALLPSSGARLEGPTFEAWLASDDAASLPL